MTMREDVHHMKPEEVAATLSALLDHLGLGVFRQIGYGRDELTLEQEVMGGESLPIQIRTSAPSGETPEAQE